MSTILTSAEIRGMASSTLKKTVKGMMRQGSSVSPKSRIKTLRAEIKGFEQKYSMTTKQMVNQVCSGKLKEQGEIEVWLNKHGLLSVHVQK